VDLQLPGLQGVRVLAELGLNAPALIRCGMSADVAPYAAVAFRRMCDLPLLTKPLDYTAASATLRRLVDTDPSGPARA
jgi:hypothetical protein